MSSGSIAYSGIIKSGCRDELTIAISSLPEMEALESLQFFTSTINDCDLLIAIYVGRREAWREMTRKGYLETLEPHLVQNGASSWRICETLCQLRPETAAAQEKCEWYAAITGLKPDREADYRILHECVWPGVIDAIGESSISDFDIFLTDITGDLHLIYRMRYIGVNYSADMEKMAANPVNQRWWKFTNPCQEPLPMAAARKEIWQPIENLLMDARN